MSDELRALTARVTALEQRSDVCAHTHTGTVTFARAEKESDAFDTVFGFIGFVCVVGLVISLITSKK